MTMLPITYGYARVSKADDEAKNLDTQILELQRHGIRPELIFTDIASGRSMNRPGWQDLMSRIQPGDTVVIAFLDRLSRSFEDGVRIQAELTQRNIAIVALRENIDTREGSAAAKFFRRSMLAQGAYQVDSASERIKLGLDRARAEGKRVGQPSGAVFRPDGAVPPDGPGRGRTPADRPGDAVLAGHGEEGPGGWLGRFLRPRRPAVWIPRSIHIHSQGLPLTSRSAQPPVDVEAGVVAGGKDDHGGGSRVFQSVVMLEGNPQVRCDVCQVPAPSPIPFGPGTAGGLRAVQPPHTERPEAVPTHSPVQGCPVEAGVANQGHPFQQAAQLRLQPGNRCAVSGHIPIDSVDTHIPGSERLFGVDQE